MAVGKAVAVPNVVVAAAACREALQATVAEFTETFASLSITTIKRRLKDATIVMPNGLSHDGVIECKVEEKAEDAVDSL